MPQNPSRRNLRTLRRQLSQHEQRAHSLQVSRHLQRSLTFQRSQHIAVYDSADGEVDLSPLLNQVRQSGKRWFLPVLRRHPNLSLWFAEYRVGDHLQRNRFGIFEPRFSPRKITRPWGLNLILMPLVGFDLQGNRLGMGGGYYDRTLSYLRFRRDWKAPMLIGVAHECQRVEALVPNRWDIPLNGVVTEADFYMF